jgi:hypothetical protein
MQGSPIKLWCQLAMVLLRRPMALAALHAHPFGQYFHHADVHTMSGAEK